MFITAHPMKQEAYPLEPGEKGSSVSCQIWRPMATRMMPSTATQPETSQSSRESLRIRYCP